MYSCLKPMQNNPHPMRINIENINIIIWSPYMSIRSPLISGKKIFGKLYTEYKKEKDISDYSFEYDFSSWVTSYDLSKAGESNIK